MKIFVQWALSTAAGWEQLDSIDFQGLPKKGVPNGLSTVNGAKGWINALNIQGVEFIGYDHYAVESLANGACRVTIWKDDPDDLASDQLGEFYARQWTFQRLAQSARHGGAWNTRQSQVCFAGPKLTQFYADNPCENLTVLPWADFIPPPDQFVRHGVWLPDALMEASNPLRTLKDWREWTDGVPPEQIDENSKLKPQRAQGLYDKPKGTKTYGLRATDLAAGWAVATNENIMTRDAFGASETESSNSLSGGGSELSHLWSTFSDEPDSADWPSGNYRCSINVSAVGADISYGFRTSGAAGGFFARVLAGLSSTNATWTQTEALFTGTGIKVGTTGTIDPVASDATDRFGAVLAVSRPASHGNQSLTITYNSDSFADGPWTVTQNFSLDAQPGSFTLTGAVAGAVAGRAVDAQPGSFTLTGFAATLAKGLQLDAQPASFAVTGIEAGLLTGRVLDAQPGSIALTGFDATLAAGKTFNAEPGTFVLTGMLAELVRGYVADAQPGSFVLTGNAAALIADRVLSADPGAIILTGTEAGLLAGRLVIADPGVYVVTGFDAALVFSGAAQAFEINAEPGVFVITGAEAGLLIEKALNGEPGSFAVTGINAGLAAERLLNAEPGTLTLTGFPAWANLNLEDFPAGGDGEGIFIVIE